MHGYGKLCTFKMAMGCISDFLCRSILGHRHCSQGSSNPVKTILTVSESASRLDRCEILICFQSANYVLMMSFSDFWQNPGPPLHFHWLVFKS